LPPKNAGALAGAEFFDPQESGEEGFYPEWR
jgi:hypothetical protein